MEIRIVLALFLLQVIAYAWSTDLASGKSEYVFGIPESLTSGGTVSLYISSIYSTRVHVEAPFVGLNYTRSINQDSISLRLDKRLQMQGSSIAKKSVYIKSDEPILVQVIINDANPSSDGFLALPLKDESTEFYVATYTSTRYYNQLLIAALFDSTNIQIRIKLSYSVINFNSQNFANGQIFHRVLNKYDILQLQSRGDLTGTFIKSSKPITVLSGNKCLKIQGACDVTLAQMTPLVDWKTEFLVSEFANDVETVTRVMAAEDNTNIKINGKHLVSLNQGQHHDRRRSQSSSLEFFEASKPINIVQFHDRKGSDVFMLNIPAIDQFMTHYLFEVSSIFSNNYLEIYVETGKIDGLRLDDRAVKPTNRRSVHATDLGKTFSAVQITTGKGKHKLTHTDTGTRFGAVLYGTGYFISYGFFLGFSNDPVCNPPCKNEGTCIADDTCHCQLGYRGQRCELGHALADDLKPKLYPVIDGNDNNFVDPLAWYSDPPFSDSNKVCYAKVLVKNSAVDTILTAVSSTIGDEEYGNFTAGPIDATSGITGSIRFACLEVRCPFVTISGVNSDTAVTVAINGKNNGTCTLSHSNQHVSNFTVQSYSGKSDEFEFTLEVGKNYGPYCGVYMAIGNRNKAKFIAEHKCNSGREYDYQSYNPTVGVLAEYTC